MSEENPRSTEAQKKAQQKYMEKFAVERVRMDRGKYEVVQAHADAKGESVSGFINWAIDNQMERGLLLFRYSKEKRVS